MKTFALMITVLSLSSVGLAQSAPTTSQEVKSHTYTGSKAEAEYGKIAGEGIVNGPIGLCDHTAYKVQRSENGLQQTECTEMSGNAECGNANFVKYTCTETESLDGQPLPRIPLGIAL
jgi:hypothetical protein